MQHPGIDVLRIKLRQNRFCGLVYGRQQKLGSPKIERKPQKLKIRDNDISPICQDAPTRAIGLNFDTWGRIADVITRAKFCDNWFRGFGVLLPPILPFSTGIAGRPYNSVSTTVLRWDKSIKAMPLRPKSSSTTYGFIMAHSGRPSPAEETHSGHETWLPG